MRMMEELAACMMRHVYYHVSACVCINEEGIVVRVTLFDTVFCAVPQEAMIPCERIVLISNHPDGNMKPLPEDKANAEQIRSLSGKTPELLIYSEYAGICDIKDKD